MRVVIINKSDARGGAAVVSHRLMRALRAEGVEADMLVTEKLGSDREVRRVPGRWRRLFPFLLERLQVYLGNGRNRTDLFKADTGSFGLSLHRDPLVSEADVVCIAWVNQGMLSLAEVERIASLGKPVVWVMHDMWCMTGVCHHAGDCEGFRQSCGLCPLLGRKASPHDLSARTWRRKRTMNSRAAVTYVAVSHWLRDRAMASSLLADARVEVIGNPFPQVSIRPVDKDDSHIVLLIAAARLDDPIKGLDIFKAVASRLRLNNQELTGRLKFIAAGTLRDTTALQDFPFDIEVTGPVPPADMERLYRRAHIVVSTSLYETLPGTLVEGQACGALPVAFNRGGQPDIITDGVSGVLVPFGDEPAADMEAGICRAIDIIDSTPPAILRERLMREVNNKFSDRVVARRYIELFNDLLT